MDASALAAHYAAQLLGAGWTPGDQAQAGPLVWSTWAFEDEGGQDWQGLFLAMEMAAIPDRRFVYVRTDWTRRVSENP